MTATTVSLRSLITSTLAARWLDASDAVREWAISRGYARVPDVSVECDSAEDWRDDWRDFEGGAWPCYTLTVSVDGREVGEVTGWHYVGPWSGRCDGLPSDWTERDNDGACSGRCVVRWEDDEDGPEIRPGDNVGSTLDLPRVGEDGRVLVYDDDRYGDMQRAIDDAAGDADHGPPPSLDDLDPADGEEWSRIYLIRDYRISSVEVRRIDAYPDGEERGEYGHRSKTYLLTGYVVCDDGGDPLGDVCEDKDDAVQDADLWGDDGKRYERESDAEQALAKKIRSRLEDIDLPDGLEWGHDDGGIWVAPEDAEDDDRYHLDADELSRVCLSGWYAVWDEITGAFRTRDTLAAQREWQERMDAVIAEQDPFVGIADSLAAGNCRSMTDAFASEVCEREGGEVGAVRASSILAVRDDAYTRRACRMAAHRTVCGE